MLNFIKRIWSEWSETYKDLNEGQLIQFEYWGGNVFYVINLVDKYEKEGIVDENENK